MIYGGELFLRGVALGGHLDSELHFNPLGLFPTSPQLVQGSFLPAGYEELYVWAHCTEFLSKKTVSCCFPSTGPVGVGRSDLKPMQKNTKLIRFGLFIH